MKFNQERAVHLAVIALCLIASFALVGSQLVGRPAPALERGMKPEALSSLLPPGSRRTLFLFLSPRCGFCDASLPFYGRLSQRQIPLVAVVGREEDKDAQRRALSKAGVRVDSLVAASLPSLGIQGTPCLVLVDERGMVLETWLGRLDAGGEAQVLAALEKS